LTITGGAGFIGVNAAHHFAQKGWRVTIFDNLSRPGSDQNLEWILATHPDTIDFIEGDLRRPASLPAALIGRNAVLHLAAQVAVTTSLIDPIEDFEVNAAGTLRLLEAVRKHIPDAIFLHASTNKVYGDLPGLRLRRIQNRWQPEAGMVGISEQQPLDFHSPYGCSKGTADQYVRDYARSYGLDTIVLRQSCVYGSHQNGTEDQGWVAHFVRAALEGQPITLFGDGCQVRDLLDVRDLCRLYEACFEHGRSLAGRVFNVGGGPENARSVIEVLSLIESTLKRDLHVSFNTERKGDQKYYVSDLAHAKRLTGWKPEVGFEAGLRDLVAWFANTRTLATA
jgi:CDP-paratose 2-epimerase